MTTTRLSSEERREAIVAAVKKVFAEKGFDGTTTRELAEAAGVSEALLFKHFPSKQSLYAAMQSSCCPGKNSGEARKLAQLEPSTSTLVVLVHFIFTKAVGVEREGEDSVLHRLVVRSLMEDGEFARQFLQDFTDGWIGKVKDCVKAAAAAGDLDLEPARADLPAWFIHHLAVGLMLHLLPSSPAIDYRLSKEKLVEQAVRFSLRGLGLKEQAIRRHYSAQALSLMAG